MTYLLTLLYVKQLGYIRVVSYRATTTKTAENSEILIFAISLVYDFDFVVVEKKACIGLDWIKNLPK